MSTSTRVGYYTGPATVHGHEVTVELIAHRDPADDEGRYPDRVPPVGAQHQRRGDDEHAEADHAEQEGVDRLTGNDGAA